jgi:methionyl-tRNA formyltransferase
MRIAFAGTPEFARTALEALHAAGHDIALVLTQPDRPAGRGMKLQASPVKAAALARSLRVAQPRGLRLDGRWAEDASAARAALEAVQPEALVVAAYGLILPPWVLALPTHGCLNIHASLLPRWRGAAPIHRAIEAGDRETGITIMQMDAGLDTGPMLLEERMPIRPDDTTATLQARLADLGGRLIVDALEREAAGQLVSTPQPEAGATYARKVEKDEASIDWSEPAVEIERRLRAFDPFPGATTTLGGETVKCWRGVLDDGAESAAARPPGTVLSADASGIRVACGRGTLIVSELQRAGGRRMPAGEFLQRTPLSAGEVLGAEPAGPAAD